jgi:FKBP-type peptidyl-prolyl cis-trans isomerase SlyD
MKIQDHSYVTIAYTLSLDSGEVVDRSEPEAPLPFIFGAGQVVPGVEKQLEGVEAGKDVKFEVAPEDGYGPANPALVRPIPRKQFPEELDLETGMVFQASGGMGNVVFRIKSMTDEEVLADFNHPLAGERLHFDVRVVEVREATEEDIAAMTSRCGGSPCCGDEGHGDGSPCGGDGSPCCG